MNEKQILEIYNRNIDTIYKICFIFFKGNKYDIEDAIEDIFLKVINKKRTFENLDHEKAWFIVVTNNYCKNKVKHWWNKNKELDYEIPEEIKKDETIDIVLNLPDNYKIPIYMHYYEGYSCVEIARILNKPKNTIYSYLNRGRNILKKEIEEKNNE